MQFASVRRESTLECSYIKEVGHAAYMLVKPAGNHGHESAEERKLLWSTEERLTAKKPLVVQLLLACGREVGFRIPPQKTLVALGSARSIVCIPLAQINHAALFCSSKMHVLPCESLREDLCLP